MKFCADIHGPHTMTPNDLGFIAFSAFATMILMFVVFSKMSQTVELITMKFDVDIYSMSSTG